MGKVKVFEIEYRNHRAVFHSGKRVTGCVLLEAVGNVQAQNVNITMMGKGKVHWSTRSGSSKDRQKDYRSEEYYVNNIITLLQPDAGSSNVTLTPGHYRYNFEFALPAECPSSFEGSYGYVRYWCTARLSRPWKFDVETKKACSVLSNYDLNVEPHLGNPVNWDLSHDVYCCCCSLGKVDISLVINKTGFVPGEPIKLTGRIINYTNRSIKAPKIKLEQSVNFYGFSNALFSSGRPKVETDSGIVRAQHVSGGSIPPGQTQVWDEQFFIPPLPPTGLKGAKYIDIKYSIKISVNPPMNDKITWWRAITIGTVPILRRPTAAPAPHYETLTTIQPAPTLPTAPMFADTPTPMFSDIVGPSAPAADPSPPYCNDEMPPPSYEECITGKVHIREEGESQYLRGNLDFAPSYTYYNWNSHQHDAANSRI